MGHLFEESGALSVLARLACDWFLKKMHSCPECGQACYCSGDIDDIDAGDEEATDACTHCAEGDSDGEEDDDFHEFDDDE
jgi:hypothetical protein